MTLTVVLSFVKILICFTGFFAAICKASGMVMNAQFADEAVKFLYQRPRTLGSDEKIVKQRMSQAQVDDNNTKALKLIDELISSGVARPLSGEKKQILRTFA